MILPSIAQIIILLVLFVGVLLPIILVLVSKRSRGAEKLGWVLLTAALSWLGYWIFLSKTKK